MRPTDMNARPMVLRELSLLRALGTSLRASSHRSARANRVALALSRPPPLDLMPLPALKTPLDQVSKLK